MNCSLQCAWLLGAYIADQMRFSKKPNDAVRLLFDILYEKYKPKICYKPTLPNDSTSVGYRDHVSVDEEQEEIEQPNQKHRSNISGRVNFYSFSSLYRISSVS